MTRALRVEEGSAAFGALFSAVAAAGGRAGWLELQPPGAAPTAGPGPGDEPAGGPAAAVDGGAWKAVAVAPGRTVAVKSRRGEAVLGDLLREHFRGCLVVLVRGEVALPRLRPAAGGWELEEAGGAPRALDTAALLAELRSARPGPRSGRA